MEDIHLKKNIITVTNEQSIVLFRMLLSPVSYKVSIVADATFSETTVLKL